MKTFLGFVSGMFVGAIGIAMIYIAKPEVQDAWQATANSLIKTL